MSGSLSDLKPALRTAAKSATMHKRATTGAHFMTAARKLKHREVDDSIFDDAEALIALAQKSFIQAAKKAVAENDRLGIPTHGSVNGKLVVRQPPKAAAPSHS